MNEDRKKFIKIILALVCLSIIYNYFQQVQDIPNPVSKMYSRWIKSLDLKSPNESALMEVYLQVQINKDEKITIWDLNANDKTPENISKLARLLELADSAGVFAKNNTEVLNAQNVTIEIKNPTKTYTSKLTEDQIASDPKLQTFIKLAELYAGQNNLNTQPG